MEGKLTYREWATLPQHVRKSYLRRREKAAIARELVRLRQALNQGYASMAAPANQTR
jgi:hypothetical protein